MGATLQGMFRNILVALDHTDTAQRALRNAGELAIALNARLTIISVVPEVPGYAYRAGVDVARLESEAETETDGLLREAVDSLPDDLPVTTILKHGHVGEQIVKQVEEGNHDLLVMGSRGLGRVASSLFGSVGAYVHYHSNVAMLVVHPDG
jgi:nucleotide-binding universal stress UspA family protein